LLNSRFCNRRNCPWVLKFREIALGCAVSGLKIRESREREKKEGERERGRERERESEREAPWGGSRRRPTCGGSRPARPSESGTYKTVKALSTIVKDLSTLSLTFPTHSLTLSTHSQHTLGTPWDGSQRRPICGEWRPARPRRPRGRLSSEFGTYETVKDRFWTWHPGERP